LFCFFFFFFFFFLICDSVNFNGRINGPDKDIAGNKSNGAGQKKEGERDQEHIAEKHEATDNFDDFQFGEEIQNGVEKQVHSTTPRCEEGTPPPMVVLAAQLKVHHHDGDLSACYDQNYEHDKQKPKQIVKLIQPHTAHYKEDLDEYCSERQYTADEDRKVSLSIPRTLSRDHARYQINFDRMFNIRLAKSKITPKVDQRDRDAEPENE